MTDETLKNILNHFFTKYKSIRSDQSEELLEKLTLSQYKNLADIDVKTYTELFQGLENYLTEHLEVQKLETALKRKKCALAVSLKNLDARFSEAATETEKRNERLRSGDTDFLKPAPTASKPVFAKPTVQEKTMAPVIEPTYSTRVVRTKVQPVTRIPDASLEPPTYSSNVKFSKTAKTPMKTASFSLDDSLINGNLDISIVNDENFQKQLRFDDIDEDNEKEKTPARVRRVAKTPSTVRQEPKPVDLSSMPPPPVFTSATGRVFNEH